MSELVFISYSHKDEEIALNFSDYLKKCGCDIFLASQTIKIGDKWPEKITEALNKADYFLVLLSMQSLSSDMVTEEIKIARQLYDKVAKPKIFPIRINLKLNYNINYDLAGYLNRFQQRVWTNSKDTIIICNEIIDIIKAIPLNNENWEFVKPETMTIVESFPVPNAPLEIPLGQVGIDSPFYIKRKGEDKFIENILISGSLLRIKAPRQYGKTSLLSRIGLFASKHSHIVISISFQQLQEKTLNNLDLLLQRLCYEITMKTNLPNKISQYWEDEFLDEMGKCTKYFEKYLLENIESSLLLILDEGDVLFSYDNVYKHFYGLLRFWNERGKNDKLWGKLKVAIAYSTEYHLVLDVNQSPFNVGLEKILDMFTPEDVSCLALVHNLNLTSLQIEKLMSLIGGHPFLIRMALYVLAQGEEFDSLLQTAVLDNGHFHDHLIRFQWIFSQQPNCSATFKQILENSKSTDTLINVKLAAAGLIRGSTPDVKPAFELYKLYFKNKI
jgi:hypothetical protein